MTRSEALSIIRKSNRGLETAKPEYGYCITQEMLEALGDNGGFPSPKCRYAMVDDRATTGNILIIRK